jgi:hypothetical protein
MKYPHIFLAALLAVATLASGPAAAKVNLNCYTPDQLQAEQLLRLHSELMVITVTCKTGSNGQDLGAAYGNFTKKHITALHGAEQTMIAYYKTNAKGNALDHLDRLRTTLANEFGQKSADMSSTNFCAQYRDKVVKYDNIDGADVQNEVQRMVIAERSYVPACGGGTAAVKN